MSRKLDKEIAIEIYKWVWDTVPKDAHGNYAGKTLVPHPGAFSNWIYPPIGEVAATYHVPLYSSSLYLAMKVAQDVGVEMWLMEIPLDPEKICEIALAHLRYKNHGKH